MRATEKIATILIVAFGVWFAVMWGVTSFEGHQTNRLLMVELGGETATLQLAVQPDSKSDATGIAHNKEMVVRNTYMDFVLIALYWSMFVALAYLAGRLGKWMMALFAGASITAAAIADLLENQAILVAMHVRNFTDAVAVDIAEFSQAKWAFFFVAVLTLGFAIARNQHTSQVRRVAGWLFVASGTVGLLGLSRNRVALDFAMGMISAAMVLLGAALLVTLWKLVVSVKELEHTAHHAHAHG